MNIFTWFKRKTLDEKITKVREYARIHQLSAKHAYLLYMNLAFDYGWEDAAGYFLSQHVKQKLQECV